MARLAIHASKAHADDGVSELLVIVRMRKLAAIEEVMGRAAVEHLLARVRSELERFSGGGNLVVPLEEGAFAVVRAARLEDAEDLAHRMVSTVSRPVSFGAEMVYA